MNCPMIQPKIEVEEGEEVVRMGRCTEGDCAWWSEELKQCDPTGMLPHIIALSSALDKLVEIMPRGTAFRK